jgi:DNA polymerase
VVRHRPPENRDPLPDEVTACDVWLRRHLEILKPRSIVTLGRHAMYKFFPNESISRVHGKVRRTAGSDPLTIFPMYHPAAALHQPALRSALVADFAALALFLAAEPPAAKLAAAAEKPADQMTLFRD